MILEEGKHTGAEPHLYAFPLMALPSLQPRVDRTEVRYYCRRVSGENWGLPEWLKIERGKGQNYRREKPPSIINLCIIPTQIFGSQTSEM